MDDERIRKLLEDYSSDESCPSGSDIDEEELISQRSDESDTEEEFSNLLEPETTSSPATVTCPEEDNNSSIDRPYARYVYGKDHTKWNKDCYRTNVRTRSENIISVIPGVKGPARNVRSEYDCWKLFVCDEIIKEILVNTNCHIRNKQKPAPTKTQTSYMKELCKDELLAFIGLLYLAGLNKANRQNLNDLWRTDGTGIDIFRNTMSLQRFYFIMNCIRFDDSSTRLERKQTDRLAPIRSLHDKFVLHCQENYDPSEYLTIDEKLDSFRGRCVFVQYMPNKPAKYGLKSYLLVDAKSFYIVNLELYAGTQPPGPYNKSNKPFDVVDKLVQPISQSSRNITFDNWFTSYPLTQHLLSHHKLTSVGTIRKNKREIPASISNARGRDIHSSEFIFQKDTTLVSYVPKKNKVVLVISTMHHDNSIDVMTGDKRKPEMITFYNRTKGGVDVVDELCANYDVSRNSKRWPLTFFYSLLNMAGINSYIIRKENCSLPNLKRREFLRVLGLKLVENHLRTRKDTIGLHTSLRKRINDSLGEPSPAPPPKIAGIARRCQDCAYKKDRKTKHTCCKCNKFICMEHAETICKNCAAYSQDTN
ncbi:piggyBac transposable element-derived protein 4-like [Melitaea cinxia]|uniref:piggyBac transposable element-derived protein 4-like n=1 Tax=Melitaea cinxia TaxID=113334 RepID=UPI001E26FE24|nr:piggyBac transposable element-derived protein 4-like [Melitaea cinxia]